MDLVINGVENLQIAVDQLIKYAEARKKWTFTGEIGAGKTTFIQSICRSLGVKEKVTSPTFSLINEYTYTDNDGKIRLIYHIDLYRLNSLEEAIDIGIEDYLDDDNYCFIEWPQLLQPVLPENLVEINLEIIENSKRKIIFL
jgi:tRNA threonylcarbamoyladenosine biosynthesis protein TsaE